MKTYSAKKGEVVPKWHVVDVEGKVLGRVASQIATVLQGKHRPEYTPHVDCGDFVIVVNAAKVRLTGNKLTDKQYTRYSGYPSGLRTETAAQRLARKPDVLVSEAVRRMLPKNRLGRAMLKKLKVYAGPTHEHQAQKPEPLEV